VEPAIHPGIDGLSDLSANAIAAPGLRRGVIGYGLFEIRQRVVCAGTNGSRGVAMRRSSETPSGSGKASVSTRDSASSPGPTEGLGGLRLNFIAGAEHAVHSAIAVHGKERRRASRCRLHPGVEPGEDGSRVGVVAAGPE
jgi:hypothetical protein